MNPLAIGGIIETVGKVIDDLHTSDRERLELALEAQKIDAQLAIQQSVVNAEEAKHSSIFVAGWRPAVGWVGALGLAYQFILYPFLIWAWALMQASDIVPKDLSAPPLLDVEALMVLLSGILGLGIVRGVEKIKGVAR